MRELADGRQLDQPADPEDVTDVIGCRSRHVGPVVRLAAHESLADEDLDGFPDGVTRNAELSRQRPFAQAGTGGELCPEDQLPDRARDLLGGALAAQLPRSLDRRGGVRHPSILEHRADGSSSL